MVWSTVRLCYGSVLLCATQMAVTDMTAMPVTGSIFISALPSYESAISAALSGKECAVQGASVCAFNVVDDAQASGMAYIFTVSLSNPCAGHEHLDAYRAELAWPRAQAGWKFFTCAMCSHDTCRIINMHDHPLQVFVY